MIMKSRSLFLGLLNLVAVSVSCAEPPKPLSPAGTLPVIAAPSLIEPLSAPWSVAHGTWTPENGVLNVVELPENKHVAVLHHKVGLESALVECEFRFDGPGVFLIGCDGGKHIGRVVVRPDGMSIAEDSAKPSHTLETLKAPVTAGGWHQLRVEWKGDSMVAALDGQEIRAQHPFLASPKSQSWLAVGKTAQLRALKISGIPTPAAP